MSRRRTLTPAFLATQTGGMERERNRIALAIIAHGGNVTRAHRAFGAEYTERSFWRWVKHFGLLELARGEREKARRAQAQRRGEILARGDAAVRPNQ